LVIGVATGLFLVAVRFSWTNSQDSSVTVTESTATAKRYCLNGTMFFGLAMRFHKFFDVESDPDQVTLELAKRPVDYSGVDAIQRLTALYASAGKTLKVEMPPPAEPAQNGGTTTRADGAASSGAYPEVDMKTSSC